MEDLIVGDFCLTQYTRGGAINDGALVRVVAIDPAHAAFADLKMYLIQRLDGMPIGAVYDVSTDALSYYSDMRAWSPRHMLRRLDPRVREDLELVATRLAAMASTRLVEPCKTALEVETVDEE